MGMLGDLPCASDGEHRRTRAWGFVADETLSYRGSAGAVIGAS